MKKQRFPPVARRILALIGAMIVLAAALATPAFADQTEYEEYDFKYSITYRFTRFGEQWNSNEYSKLEQGSSPLKAMTAQVNFIYVNGHVTKQPVNKVELCVSYVPDGTETVSNVFTPIAVLYLWTPSATSVDEEPDRAYEIGIQYGEYDEANPEGQVKKQRVRRQRDGVFLNLETISISMDDTYFSLRGDEAVFHVTSCVNLIGGELLTKDGYDLYWSGGYYTGYDTGYDHGVADGEAVGYGRGYAEGQAQGLTDGRAQGYESGYGAGYIDGETEGFQDGQTDALSAKGTFKDLVFGIFDAPVRLIEGMLDFNIFDINVLSLVKTILTLGVTALIITFIVKFAKG